MGRCATRKRNSLATPRLFRPAPWIPAFAGKTRGWSLGWAICGGVPHRRTGVTRYPWGTGRAGLPPVADRLAVRAFPPALTPPRIPGFPGKTRWWSSGWAICGGVPHSRTGVTRYPWGMGRAGLFPVADRLAVRAFPPALTPPWIPAFAGKTRGWSPDPAVLGSKTHP